MRPFPCAADRRGPDVGPLPLLAEAAPIDARVRAALSTPVHPDDPALSALIAAVVAQLEALGPTGHVAVPLLGSGAHAVEAMLNTLITGPNTCLVCVNGAGGQRAIEALRRLGRPAFPLRFGDDEPIDPDRLAETLAEHPELSHVFVVHDEGTGGVLSPLSALAAVAQDAGRALLIDATRSFGRAALGGLACEALAACSEGGLEGAPGLALVLAAPVPLSKAAERCSSVQLDVHAQWRHLAQRGAWRGPAPVGPLAALSVALGLLSAEGGPVARGARCAALGARLSAGMAALGISCRVPEAARSPTLLTFTAPAHPAWDWPALAVELRAAGFAVEAQRRTVAPTFSVATGGVVDIEDVEAFLSALGGLLSARGLGPAALRAAP